MYTDISAYIYIYVLKGLRPLPPTRTEDVTCTRLMPCDVGLPETHHVMSHLSRHPVSGQLVWLERFQRRSLGFQGCPAGSPRTPLILGVGPWGSWGFLGVHERSLGDPSGPPSVCRMSAVIPEDSRRDLERFWASLGEPRAVHQAVQWRPQGILMENIKHAIIWVPRVGVILRPGVPRDQEVRPSGARGLR